MIYIVLPLFIRKLIPKQLLVIFNLVAYLFILGITFCFVRRFIDTFTSNNYGQNNTKYNKFYVIVLIIIHFLKGI